MHKDFRDTLIAFITEHGIRQIVAEDVNVMGHFFDMRRLSERAAFSSRCAMMDLPEPEFVNVSTLKKWATGDGRADKAKMMRACVERYHYTPKMTTRRMRATCSTTISANTGFKTS